MLVAKPHGFGGSYLGSFRDGYSACFGEGELARYLIVGGHGPSPFIDSFYRDQKICQRPRLRKPKQDVKGPRARKGRPEEMRAIAIDPMRRLVVEVEVGPDEAHIRGMLDADALEEAYCFETGDVLLLDRLAEGRAAAALRGADDGSRAFWFDIGVERIFFGPALVVGVASSGEWHDVTINPERLASITFDGPDLAYDTASPAIN